MKIVITGGHVSPALALIPRLLQSHTIVFIGRKHVFEGDDALSFEYRTIKSLKIPFRTIISGRFKRHQTLYTILSLLKLPLGLFQATIILLKEKPDIVLSFGGYVALPVCLSARALGIPIVIHEQTLVSGIANKIVGHFAKRICVSFKDTLMYFPKEKTFFTGNPVRRELFYPPKKSPFPKLALLPLVYITGGSGGSHSINMLISAILSKLVQNFVVIHQTGDSSKYKDFDVLEKKAKRLPKWLSQRYILRRFVNTSELAWIYANCKLLIGRCGANTVHEIFAFGIPSILVPLPWAGGAEQEASAKLVKNVGLGIVLHQENLSANLLLVAISKVARRNEEFRKNKKNAQKFVVPDADERIIKILETMYFDEKRAKSQ